MKNPENVFKHIYVNREFSEQLSEFQHVYVNHQRQVLINTGINIKPYVSSYCVSNNQYSAEDINSTNLLVLPETGSDI
jgi:hypothetical protein